MQPNIVLENHLYRIEVEPQYGRIVRLRDVAGEYEVIAEPRLADNWRLLLPLPGIECNYIDGREQPLGDSRLTAESLTLMWHAPLRNAQGEFDLPVVVDIMLVDEEIQFFINVANNTRHTLTEVWGPIIGGMRGIGNGEAARDTMVFIPQTSVAWVQPIFRDFGNTRGQTLGVPTAEHSFAYPSIMSMPWGNLHSPQLNRSIYTAVLEETPRVKTLRFSMEPGLAEMRPGGNWPRPEEVGDLPVGLIMDWDHFPFLEPGELFSSAPMVLRSHEGDWQAAAEIYRAWFDERYSMPDPRGTWLHQETAFLFRMLLLPQDNVLMPFRDIPAWAQGAVEHGLTSVMLAGWDVGGHDRGYPYYEPDPRLGTWEELRDAITACHELGLRVYLFANCQPIDMTTEWYKNELHQYRILDPYGEQFFVINYWGMGTLSARHRFITATPFSEMNPAHPEVRDLLIRQFVKLVECGADGLHIDKFFQTPFDFNPRLRGIGNPDSVHHRGMLTFVEEMLAACRAVNPDFCFSYEGGWDRLYPYTNINWWGGDRPSKAVFPESATTLGIEQPWDYGKVNSAVLEGANLLIGPANYTCGLDWEPMRPFARYIAEVTRIRRELLPIVSRGAKLDASDGIFKRATPLLQMQGDFAANPHGRWSVFQDVHTGRRAAVLVNFTAEPLTVESLSFADVPEGACRVHEAFAPVRDAVLPLTLTIPADRAVFVVEHS